MSDEQKERLSGLLDGEIQNRDRLINDIVDDPSLRDTWSRYHLIRDVMTNHFVNSGHPDIADRVRQALKNEPTVIAPHRWREPVKSFVRQSAGFAIAATVAAVAVLGIQEYRQQDTGVTQLAKTTDRKVVVVSARVSPGVENKLSNYLVNHNEYSASSRMQGMLPYMRIVGYTPTRRVGNEP